LNRKPWKNRLIFKNPPEPKVPEVNKKLYLREMLVNNIFLDMIMKFCRYEKMLNNSFTFNNNNNNNVCCLYSAYHYSISKRFTLLPQQVYEAQPFTGAAFYYTPFSVPGT
jgi:hypothetical protein